MKKNLIILAIGVGGITFILVILSFIKNPPAAFQDYSARAPQSDQSVFSSPTPAVSQNNQTFQRSQQSRPESTAETSPSSPSLQSAPANIPEMAVEIPTGSNLAQELPLHFSRIEQELYQIQAVNPQGQTLDLVKHLKESQIYFPPDLLDIIENISFFIYQGDADLGPSEAMLITNEASAFTNAEVMIAWEPTMIRDLHAFILIGEKYDLIEAAGKKQFARSTKFPDTRYVNFSQDKAVSLSYTAGSGFILISNSFTAQETMVELLDQR